MVNFYRVKNMNFKNMFKHLKLITHHKWVVFKLCCKIGEPWRGLVHDLSKYSPTEFGESIKYYSGKHSPITEARLDKGYSEAWLHHKGRNKHHTEYWIDNETSDKMLVMPYKYAAEMVCDMLAAGIVYEGKNWTKESELAYWNREKQIKQVNPKIKEFITQVAEKGIVEVLTKKNIKSQYDKCVNK